MTKKVLSITIILIILLLILLISINKFIKVSNLEYYNNSEKEMIKASKLYFKDYSNYLPKEKNKTTRVILNALVKEDYINMIRDINNKKCNLYKSYVEVKKVNDKEYLYKAYLVCDKSNYKTKDRE